MKIHTRPIETLGTNPDWIDLDIWHASQNGDYQRMAELIEQRDEQIDFDKATDGYAN